MDRNDVLILIALGVTATLILMCCGVCILSVWLGPRPGAEPNYIDQNLVKNYDKIKTGMTEKEVDLVLGEENKTQKGNYSFKELNVTVVIEYTEEKVSRKEMYKKLK